MMYLAVVLLSLTIVSGSIFTDDMFKNMTSAEIREVFYTGFVPNHEIVKVHLSKRSRRDLAAGRKMRIRAFGENISIWLHPGNSILAGQDTPVYYAKYSPNNPMNVEFSRWNGSLRMAERMYENHRLTASFIISTEESGNTQVDNGLCCLIVNGVFNVTESIGISRTGLYMRGFALLSSKLNLSAYAGIEETRPVYLNAIGRKNGYIGSKRLAVRSLPTRIAEEYRRRRRSVGDFDDVDSPFHVVFQIPENNEDDFSVLPINTTSLRRRIARSVTGINQDTLYPEVLVVVEYSLYRTYDRDVYRILQYVLAFVNGVDLKYRSIEDPKIRFHISGIIIAQDRKATPFISSNSLGRYAFDINKAMTDAAKFFYAVKDTFPLGSYDIPLIMTRQIFGVDENADIMGQAWFGGACLRDDNSRTLKSVAIIQDNGAFSGVHVAAHEIGHLMGAHDDTITIRDDCLYNHGYIMSSIEKRTKKSSDFSTCSINAIYNTLLKSKLNCLFNVPPSTGLRLREFMPGKIKDLEEQCMFLGKKSSCQNPNGPTDICVEIFCESYDGSCMATGTAASDGTTCGDQKFCLHMQCVNL